MNKAALKNELTDDPLGRGYSGMSDSAAADSLNAANRAVVRSVSAQSQRMWLAGEIHQKIAAGVDTGATDTLKGICRSALLMATNEDEYVRADHLALLDALVAGGILTQAEADALDDKADATISRAEELGLGLVGEQHITKARQ